MTEDPLRVLWARFLAGDRLSPEERADLEEALRIHQALRSELLLDFELDGAIRGLAWAAEEPESGVRAFLARVAAEEEGSRFIRKVRTELDREEDPGTAGTRGSGSLRPSGRVHRHSGAVQWSTQSGGEVEGWKFALLAAGLLLAALITAAILSPDKDPWVSRGIPSRDAAIRPRAEREDGKPSGASAVWREKEERAFEIGRKQEELARRAQRPGEDARGQEKRASDRKRLEADKEQMEREMREATQLAGNARLSGPAESSSPEAPVPGQASPTEAKKTPLTVVTLATVERAEGSVFVLCPPGKTPARTAQGISPGQGVETGPRSEVVLRYPDGTRLEVGPDTRLEDLQTQGGKRVSLARGVVWAEVSRQPKDEPMIFRVPQGEAKVLGTTLRLVVDPPGRGWSWRHDPAQEPCCPPLGWIRISPPSGFPGLPATLPAPLRSRVRERILAAPRTPFISFSSRSRGTAPSWHMWRVWGTAPPGPRPE
jgi:hypothetical protein